MGGQKVENACRLHHLIVPDYNKAGCRNNTQKDTSSNQAN